MESKEKQFKGLKWSGFAGIFLVLAVIAAMVFLICLGETWSIVSAYAGGALFLGFFLWGFTIVEPNEAKVMVFFGKYNGTIFDNGFFWVIPFYRRKRITLRARNLDVPPIKVNDKAGNPVMIGSVLVWKVKDTYKAMFEIDTSSTMQSAFSLETIEGRHGPSMTLNAPRLTRLMQSYENFVKIQSDAALRKITGMYAYDSNENGDNVSLRSSGDEVADKLEEELNHRLAIAGIEVLEARINYLAYASEIAGVMLRRQQADAIISARERIVEGAVSMVQLALSRLEKESIVTLDEDKKAAMVGNLLVVLCADEAAQPVINTGTLHH